ncbi:toxin-antitoxin system TumE family protein [Bacillus toyonensis]|uniref:toxin-antitoxin system TumE family protein n=1 Tax=Bacillus toyonensis TaxID=155322 RepID=UPI000BFD40FE|nr:DUF6516 family protein [Bacillus toyonensis]PHD33043.1 hypothetical protein COF48_19145 [Bacillus toyonensis]
MPNLHDYLPIITRFNNIFRQSPILDLEQIDTNTTVVKITLYLKNAFYGETKLRVREWFDENDNKFKYRYVWEKNRTDPGHISAWENEHNHNIKTDPHHHHHIVGNRHPVQCNWHTRDLESALSVVEEYILENKIYDGRMV